MKGAVESALYKRTLKVMKSTCRNLGVGIDSPATTPDSFHVLQYIIKLARALHRKSKNLKIVGYSSSADVSFPGKDLTTCTLITPGRDTALVIPQVVGGVKEKQFDEALKFLKERTKVSEPL